MNTHKRIQELLISKGWKHYKTAVYAGGQVIQYWIHDNHTKNKTKHFKQHEALEHQLFVDEVGECNCKNLPVRKARWLY